MLADRAADGINIEHPVTGNAASCRWDGEDNTHNINFSMKHSNRGKRSLGLNSAKSEGKALLAELKELGAVR
ncbi:MAG: crotonobetainyl-CoA:carnitine CoA-transferase CaiB-like acyl-CoA transferase [Myxococcota bacterium]|jgi:crotonobetainyl-CoA:carnitine CoA-transferase CaiB-like acyl-CoA transferase